MTHPRLKPLAAARRLAPLVQRARPALSPHLEEQLFRDADVLSEGDVRDGAGGEASYFGSTMIRLDLNVLAPCYRGTLDTQAVQQLLELMEGSVRCHLRVTRIACNEVARRVPQYRLGTAQVDVRMRVANLHLHIDVDIEVPLGAGARVSAR